MPTSNGDYTLPGSSIALIEDLAKHFQPPTPVYEDLATEHGRLQLAFELGQADVVTWLRDKQERAKAPQ